MGLHMMSNHQYLTPRELFSAIIRHSWIVLLTVTVALALAFFLRSSGGPVYDLSASFLFSKTRQEQALGVGQSRALVRSISEGELNSEVEIARSAEVVEKLAELMHEHLNVEDLNGRSLDDTKSEIAGSLTADVLHRSNVLVVGFRTGDPKFGFHALTYFKDAYEAHRAEIHGSLRIVNFYRTQLSEARNSLRQKQAELKALADENGVTVLTTSGSEDSATSTQRESAVSSYQQNRADLAQAQVALAASRELTNALSEQLGYEPQRHLTADRMAVSPELERLLAERSELVSERDSLLQRYTPNSQAVQAIQNQLSLLDGRISERETQDGGLSGTERNRIHDELRKEYRSALAEQRSLEARVGALRTALSENEAELASLSQAGFAIETLYSEVRGASQAVSDLQSRLNESITNAALDQERFLNISQIKAVQMPYGPSGTSVPLLLAFFGLIGLGLGLVLAVARYLLESKVSNRNQLERRLNLPCLAHLPQALPQER